MCCKIYFIHSDDPQLSSLKAGVLRDYLEESKLEANSSEKSKEVVTFMVYFATDGDGKMKPVKEMSKKGQKLTEINGETSTLSKFRVLFPEVKSKNVMDFYTYSTNVQSLTDIYPDSMRRLGGKYVEWNNNPKVPKYHFLLNLILQLFFFII